MSWDFYYRPYVSAAERRANAAREVARMSKAGKSVSPITIEGRKIASTFWGKAWCQNLEAYSDYASRLPRGRTYVRNGSVVHLQIVKGNVTAIVSGSELYKVDVRINPLTANLWKTLQTDCSGKIDSLIELLQGRLSDAIMQMVTRAERGLFPTPGEIRMKCSCPDWADMCKHVAAVLYGIGARLDQKPELLFLLRGVDPEELISKASAAEAIRQTTAASGPATIAESELADVFGIEVEASATKTAPSAAGPVPKKRKPKSKKKERGTAGKLRRSRRA